MKKTLHLRGPFTPRTALAPWLLLSTVCACQSSVPIIQQPPTDLLRQPEFVPAAAASSVSCDTEVVCSAGEPPRAVESEHGLDDADCLEALANSDRARTAALFHGQRCDAAERAVQFAATAVVECRTRMAQFEAASDAAIVLCSYGCESSAARLWFELVETAHTELRQQWSSFSTERKWFIKDEYDLMRASCEERVQ